MPNQQSQKRVTSSRRERQDAGEFSLVGALANTVVGAHGQTDSRRNRRCRWLRVRYSRVVAGALVARASACVSSVAPSGSAYARGEVCRKECSPSGASVARRTPAPKHSISSPRSINERASSSDSAVKCIRVYKCVLSACAESAINDALTDIAARCCRARTIKPAHSAK